MIFQSKFLVYILRMLNIINPLIADPTKWPNTVKQFVGKWPNTLKQFVGKLPTNCLSVVGHFVNLALKGLKSKETPKKVCVQSDIQQYSRLYADMRARKNYSVVLFGNHSQDTLHGKIFYINASCKMVDPSKLLINLKFQGQLLTEQLKFQFITFINVSKKCERKNDVFTSQESPILQGFNDENFQCLLE